MPHQKGQWIHLDNIDRDADTRDLLIRADVNIIGSLSVNGSPLDGGLGFTPENVANKDTDTTLAADSDVKYPSQRAIKEFVSNAIAIATGNTPQVSALVSGGIVVWESEYTFRVSNAVYFIQGQLYSAVEQTITLDAADPTNDRIDVLVLDTAGLLVKITGAAAAQPSEPDFDPSSQLKLTFVLVAAASTQPENVSNEDIYLENTEWTSSTSGSGWNANSTSNPFSGTKTIEGTNVGNGAYVQLQRAESIALDTFATLSLFIRSKANFGNNRLLRMQFFLDGVAKGTALTLATGFWGFDANQTVGYQFIAIPLAQFVLAPGQLINQFRITDVGGALGVYIDNVVLQATATDLSVPPMGITQTQANALYLPYPTVRAVSNTASALISDDVIIADVSAGSFALNLHAAALRNRTLHIKIRSNGGSNVLTLDPDGSETIDGSATLQLSAGDKITLIKDPSSNTAWESIR